jgi:hypothetical protein
MTDVNLALVNLGVEVEDGFGEIEGRTTKQITNISLCPPVSALVFFILYSLRLPKAPVGLAPRTLGGAAPATGLADVLPKNFLLMLTVLNFFGAELKIELDEPAAGEFTLTKEDVGISDWAVGTFVGVADVSGVSVVADTRGLVVSAAFVACSPF